MAENAPSATAAGTTPGTGPPPRPRARPSPSLRLPAGARAAFGQGPVLLGTRDPDLDTKIRALTTQAAADRDRPGGPPATRARSPLAPLNIRTLDKPGGRSRIFRILLTNACRYDCFYCPMRRGRNLQRHALEPHRLVDAFRTALRRGWADSLFLTTAIPGDPGATADRMLRVVESLRFRHGFRGYIHCKIVPGAAEEQVRRLALLCNRVSCNLEFACGGSFEQVAPDKDREDTLVAGGRVLRIARTVWEEGRRRGGRDPLRPSCRSGATTQFVVGATAEPDRLLLHHADRLRRQGRVHHTHFAAFRPIRSTPLEDRPETPWSRERRLYQAEVLLRRYGYRLEELPFDARGGLPLETDPKTAWARAHPERFPVELLRADREELLRVPGIGEATARRIVEHRRGSNLVNAASLVSLGVQAQARPWLSLRGRRLGRGPSRQLAFGFEAGAPTVDEKRRTYEVSPGTFR